MMAFKKWEFREENLSNSLPLTAAGVNYWSDRIWEHIAASYRALIGTVATELGKSGTGPFIDTGYRVESRAGGTV